LSLSRDNRTAKNQHHRYAITEEDGFLTEHHKVNPSKANMVSQRSLLLKVFIYIFFVPLLLLYVGIIDAKAEINKQIKNPMSANVAKRLGEKAERELIFKKEILSNFVQQIENKVRAIANNDFTLSYAAQSGEKNRSNLAQLFYIISAANDSFMQIRFLDVQGWGKVRVDRPKDQDLPVIVKDKGLQNKGKRGYFLSIKGTPSGKLWQSKFDLNMERGKIDNPLNPTFRVGTPIYHHNVFKGIVIINLRLSPVLKLLRNSNDFDIYLVDHLGNYILHPNINKEWSRYFPERGQILDTFPVRGKMILTTNSYNNNLFSYSFGQKLHNDEKLKLILTPKREVLTLFQNDDRQNQMRLLVAKSLNFTSAELKFLSNHRVIKVHNEYDWPPFNFSKNGVPTGLSVDYMDLLANRIGIEIQYISGEWGELLQQAFEKKLDVMLNIVKTPERQEYLLYTENYLKNPNVIVSKNGSNISGIESLFGKKVSFTSGFFYEELLKRKYPNIIRVPVKDTLASLKAVQLEQADAALGEMAVIRYIMRDNLLTGLEVKNDFDSGNPEIEKLNIAVRNDWPELRSILVKAMASISSEEEQNLKKKWLHSDRVAKEIIDLSIAEKAWIKSNPVITIGNEDDWPPFDFSINGDASGYSIDYLKALAEIAGLKLRFVNGFTWSQLLDKIKKKEIDVLPALADTPDRRQYIDFTNFYMENPTVIVVKEGTKGLRNIKDLKGRKLALVKGYYYVKRVSEAYPEVDIVEVGGFLDGLQSVIENQADAFIGSGTVANYTIQKHFLTGLQIVGQSGIDDVDLFKIRMGVQKGNQRLVSILNKAMDSISGEEKKSLQEKWISFESHNVDDEKIIALSLIEREWLSQHSEIRIGDDPQWAPISFLDEEGTYSGISSSYVQVISKRLGIKMNFVKDLTRTQVMEKARKKEIDMMPAIMKSTEREKDFHFTKPVFSTPIIVATRKDYSVIDGLEDLENAKVGVVKGYITAEILSKDFPNISMVEFNSLSEGLLALNGKQIDAFMDNLATISWEIERARLQDLKIAALTEYKMELAMGVRKDWPELISILNKAIDSISKEEIAAIRNTWLAVNVQFGLDIKTILIWAAPIGSAVILVFGFVVVWNRRLGQEIAERKKIDLELQNLQLTLNIALEASNTGIWKINPDTNEALYYGDQWFKQLGYNKVDFTPEQNVLDQLLHPDDMGIFNHALDEHKSGRADTFQAEFRLKAKDGTWKWIKSEGQIIKKSDSDVPAQMTGVHLDITERKKNEVALQESHKDIIESHKSITDSIKFASMIQNALLPDQELLSHFFADSFVIWQPKDVVGGDIYFIEKLRNENELLIFVIDCTGHGVPGALVTALVKAVQIQVTGEALMTKGKISPGRILSFFNIKLKFLLKQENEDADSNAGFDGGVIYYDKDREIVKYAGAETSLFYIQDGKYHMIKGDRQSIGYKKSEAYYQFKEHIIEVDRETCFYLTTDGFLDQNGGEKGYPYGKKRFKQLILDNYQKDFTEQKKIFLEEINKYRGSAKQTDDMTFTGLKVKH
jgi:PAS domain S-box-containing protein